MDKIVVFQNKKIRRTWHKEEWYFSVVDVVEALTDSSIPKRYWSDLKLKLQEENFEPYDKIVQLKLSAEDSKMRLTDCANTENMFRIIQSIPSKKAEPFKQWLAKVGYERIQEIENPELAQDRAKKYYRLKGYPQNWIEKRLRSISIRQSLTDEWKERGIKHKNDFAILTSEISKATFGMTPSEYKKFKNLPKKSKANLRDHMDDLELIFTMLGERVTTELSQKEKPETFDKNKNVAKRGGKVAGDSRIIAEKELNKPITTKHNFLPKKKKQLLYILKK
jgi:DNA-damage-inducible protein D